LFGAFIGIVLGVILGNVLSFSMTVRILTGNLFITVIAMKYDPDGYREAICIHFKDSFLR